MDDGKISEAMKSMNIVFGSSQIKKEGKFKVLSDFLGFIGDNPQYESDLDKVIQSFSSEDNGKFYEQIGGYYNAKGDKEAALRFYEKGATHDEDNFSLIKSTLLLQIDVNKFDEAVALSENALAKFPAQPLLYLLNGVANNRLSNADAALESLEMGVDFLIDDKQMEKDFYEQMALAYTQKGNKKKASTFTKKASELNTPD